ncbi:MAG: hypothetical protein WC554_13865 [Clostridia bacterium]|jgi:hypothetical protein
MLYLVAPKNNTVYIDRPKVITFQWSDILFGYFIIHIVNAETGELIRPDTWFDGYIYPINVSDWPSAKYNWNITQVKSNNRIVSSTWCFTLPKATKAINISPPRMWNF